MLFSSAYCSLSLFLILCLQIFFHVKTISKGRLDINMVFWTVLTFAERQLLLRQISSMSGISEEASNGSFNFDFGNQFWNWHTVSWTWWCFFFAAGCPFHFSASLFVSSIPLPSTGSHYRFLLSCTCPREAPRLCRVEVDTWPSQSVTYETYCKFKALYWFCRMDSKLTFIA